jgi:uncharacterized protein (DUF4415 family)
MDLNGRFKRGAFLLRKFIRLMRWLMFRLTCCVAVPGVHLIEVAGAAADDPDASLTTVADWTDARVIWPQAKEAVTLRLDKDVLAWFRQHRRAYQTRINAVLRAFVEAQRRHRRGAVG